jgi:hypothetical protein
MSGQHDKDGWGQVVTLERRVLRGVLYFVLFMCTTNLVTQTGRTAAHDLTRESLAVAVCAAVSLAGLAASSGRPS